MDISQIKVVGIKPSDILVVQFRRGTMSKLSQDGLANSLTQAGFKHFQIIETLSDIKFTVLEKKEGPEEG